MAFIALRAIRFINYLGYVTIFMCGMFLFVVVGQEKFNIFSHLKSPRCLQGGGACYYIPHKFSLEVTRHHKTLDK
jgi:hypothetical protein